MIPKRMTQARQIARLQGDGQLEGIYQWVVERVRAFEIQMDERGVFGHEGEAFPENKVVSMLKRDWRERSARGECEHLHNRVLDHIVRHALREIVRIGMKELEEK
jgi:hypothetical protein